MSTGTSRQQSTALSFLMHDLLELRTAAAAIFGIGRQKHGADAVIAERRQRDIEALALFFQEAMRHLHEDAGAVARFFLAAAGAAMLQIQENLDRHFDNVVRLAIVQIDDEADAAGIVFVPGVIQPLPGRSDGVRHITVSFWRQRGRTWQHGRY